MPPPTLNSEEPVMRLPVGPDPGILAGACTSVRKAVTPAMQPKLGIVPGSSPVEFTLVGAAAGLVHLL